MGLREGSGGRREVFSFQFSVFSVQCSVQNFDAAD
jgi:hypothetical protein